MASGMWDNSPFMLLQDRRYLFFKFLDRFQSTNTRQPAESVAQKSMVPASFSSLAQMLHSVLCAISRSEDCRKFAKQTISEPGFATWPALSTHSHCKCAQVPRRDATAPFCFQWAWISAGVMVRRYLIAPKALFSGACCKRRQRDNVLTGWACNKDRRGQSSGTPFANSTALRMWVKVRYSGRGQDFCCMREITVSASNGCWNAAMNPVTETSKGLPST